MREVWESLNELDALMASLCERVEDCTPLADWPLHKTPEDTPEKTLKCAGHHGNEQGPPRMSPALPKSIAKKGRERVIPKKSRLERQQRLQALVENNKLANRSQGGRRRREGSHQLLKRCCVSGCKDAHVANYITRGTNAWFCKKHVSLQWPQDTPVDPRRPIYFRDSLDPEHNRRMNDAINGTSHIQ